MRQIKVDKYFYYTLDFSFSVFKDFSIRFFTEWTEDSGEEIKIFYNKKIKKFVTITYWWEFMGNDDYATEFDTLKDVYDWLFEKYEKVLIADRKELEPITFYGVRKNGNN